MQKILILLLCLVAVATASIDPDGQGKRMLVLLDTYGLRETHSTFFKSLKNRGFQLTYKLADDSELSLSKYNEYLFDHLVLFCPNVVEFGGRVSTKAVVDFIDAGGNVLVGANSQLSEPIKEIAAECGVEFSDEDTFVIDRFNADVNDEGYGTLIANDAKYLINNKMIVGEKAKQGAPVLYRGVGWVYRNILRVLDEERTSKKIHSFRFWFVDNVKRMFISSSTIEWTLKTLNVC